MELPITKNTNNTREDYKAEEDIENMDEINPNLLKILEKHQDKITNITNTISVSELIGYVAFLVFLLMLTIRIAPNVSFNWLILLAPALTCVIAFTIMLNAYLNLKDLFDESENDEKSSNSSLGSVLSYFSLNTASLCVLIYLALLGCKLQNIISINFNEIAIPLYVLYGIALFYYIFIFPAFLKNKLFLQLLLCGLYIIASFVLVLLLNMKLDKTIMQQGQGGYYSLVFLSMLITIFFHMLCYAYFLSVSAKHNFLNYTSVLVAQLLLETALLLVGLKLDSVISIDSWAAMVLVIFAYMILVADKLYAIFDQSVNAQQHNDGSKNNEQYFSNNSNNNNNFESENRF